MMAQLGPKYVVTLTNKWKNQHILVVYWLSILTLIIRNIFLFRQKRVESLCVRRKIHPYAFIGLIVEAGERNVKEIMLVFVA